MMLNKLIQQGSSDKDISKVLSEIWEQQTARDESAAASSGGWMRKGIKRKMSDMAADSTNCPDTEPSTSTGHVSTTTGAPHIKLEATTMKSSSLSQRNALLTQLLSERPTKQHSVNTQHTVTPVTATPQARLPKDLTMKIMRENNNNNPGTQNKQGSPPSSASATVGGVPTTTITPRGMGGNLKENKRPTVWDNPKTSPNSPYPGNTKDSIGQQGSQGGMASSTSGSGAVANNGAPSDMLSSYLASAPGSNTSAANASNGAASVTSSNDLLGDPDLSQILQQATELQNDLSSGQLYDQIPPSEDFSKVLETVSSSFF